MTEKMKIDFGADEIEVPLEEAKSEETPVEEPKQPEPEPGTKEWFPHVAKPIAEPKAEPKAEAKPAETPNKEGYDFVDIDDPKVKERFNRLYRQMKAADANQAELKAQNKALAEKLDAILKDKHESTIKASLQDYEKKIIDAQRMGNYEQANKLMREQIKMELKPDEYTPVTKELEQAAEAARPIEQRFVEAMTPQQQDKMMEFLNSHPYATNEETQAAALRLASTLWEGNPQITLREIAETVDKQLTTWGKNNNIQPRNINNNIAAQETPPAAVQSGSRTQRSGVKTVKLTQEQARVATRLFPDVSREQALRMYAEQLELVERM